MYNSLRRGPHNKVLSFSLYGKHRLFYEPIKELTKIVKKQYPTWTIRINHDNSIDPSVICEMECHGNFDNLDFCNVNNLPVDLHSSWDAGQYMHGMTWRWLAIGDSFVDYFASRDTDSYISQREVDSVNVWMSSNTLFHVMRDHPLHGMAIVGGMWGFANVRDRALANYFFKLITNSYIASFYNSVRHKKGKIKLNFIKL